VVLLNRSRPRWHALVRPEVQGECERFPRPVCDCARLSLFLGLQQRSAAVGGSLHLAAATAPARRLVALTGRRDFLARRCPRAFTAVGVRDSRSLCVR